jgi:methanogenic corrinoid protein MtbC1
VSKTSQPPGEALPLGMLSISALSQATGVPVETLRTWERRYGFPVPQRTQAGHRVYPTSAVEPIKSIAQAIHLGHRASHVVGLPHEELSALLQRAPVPAPPMPLDPQPLGDPAVEEGCALPAEENSKEELAPVVLHWLDAIRALDEAELERGFRIEKGKLGTLRFLQERVSPMLREVGRRWRKGELTVSHEHFASERVRDFLAGLWRPMSQNNQGPLVICTTLPGEMHHLALHMAASILAMEGCRVLFLGMSTPIEDIAKTVAQSKADALLLSISSAMGVATAWRLLRELRALVPSTVAILTGGHGAPAGLEGLENLVTFDELQRWAAQKGPAKGY